MKEPFFDKVMLKDLIVGIVGTVIGIVLTIGVTYCSESRSKDEMARKTVMLTIHNIDASIANMQQLIGEMNRQDSLFRFVWERRSELDKVSADTIEMFISAMYSHNIRSVDTSTESIFSTSFEVWQYLDDEKVIGRIANCYTLLRCCVDEYNRIENTRINTVDRYHSQLLAAGKLTDEVTVLLGCAPIPRIIESYPDEIAMMRLMLDKARQLNDRNKRQLGLSQAELDKLGRLLD